MENRPWLFTEIPSMHPEVQIYTARRSNAEAPSEYRFTISTLVAYLLSYFNLVQLANAGSTYASDTAAGAAGVDIGEIYELSTANIYGMPAGILKKRIE